MVKSMKSVVRPFARCGAVLLMAFCIAGCRNEPEAAAVHGSPPQGDAPGRNGEDSTGNRSADARHSSATPSDPNSGRNTGPPERLFGTWTASNVQSPIGEVRIQLTFKEDGPVRIMAWSELPLVGQVRNKTAAYTVEGGVIRSDAVGNGTRCEYWFEDGHLMLRYEDGRVIRFTRA